ncbi:hypothetical protein [uncultured Alsobacter sp.]|uniref:polysaccharide deacetylase WbmS family protein n=1 Tax=uncultured Alsobacter sp. TaxID=1748258 RepID=UPI0025DF3FA7|nr:hypothetical protein [uncultured Alsobacter sp.]
MPGSNLVLTIDIDWAHDTVIADLAGIVAEHGVAATWFVTHDTPVLREITAIPRQDLGLHPNFNPLLDGTGSGNARAVVGALHDLVPDARCVRGHSLARSSRIAQVLVEHGITHESNHMIPPTVAPALEPWRDFSGLIHAAIRWEDDVRLLDASLGEPADHLGIVCPFVVDFHPIHVFLNTTTIAEYEAARGDARAPEALLSRRRPSGTGGSRDRLLTLLRAARGHGDPGTLLRDLKPSEIG